MGGCLVRKRVVECKWVNKMYSACMMVTERALLKVLMMGKMMVF